MAFKCPGSQDFSEPRPELIKCGFCGGEIEIWTDEIKATCPSCKKTVIRESGDMCLDWCKFAKECVGEKTYRDYLENKKKSKKGEEKDA